MTARVVISGPVPRESRKISAIAQILDVDESQVRRLVQAGELEAHRIGRRGVRVYLDSVIAYQERRSRPTKPAPRQAGPAAGQARKAASSAALKAAMAELRAEGVIP
ncbi:MAG: helix-turn-helix domain-containing protein [Alphaproteobacteria bacterium]|nr:helix-turn-helix domain-containing protein [Alphaproteobacteria bacterium]